MSRKHILITKLLCFLNLACTHNNIAQSSRCLNNQVKSISVDSNYGQGNWKPLLKKVRHKRIILLGELNHGSKEIFLSRNDLIESLHKELGFNVILFESGIGELIEINAHKNDMLPKEMTYGFFGPWRTHEFMHLMDYVKSNNISVSGFDVQRTGTNFQKTLTYEMLRLSIDYVKFHDIEERFSKQKTNLTRKKAVFDSLKDSTNNLIKEYESLKLFIEKSKNLQLNETSYFVIRTIENRITYLQYYLDFVKDKDWNKRWKARDFMMFSNIDWLLKTVYKNKKVIVIAHNFHVSKFNKNEEVMGEFLKEEYGSDMYSIGVFAGKGSFLNNQGTKEELKPIISKDLDIKNIITKLKFKVGYLYIPKKPSKNLKWLFEDIIVNDTFIDLSGSKEMNLSKSFDGLILIDKISPPIKL